MNSITRTLSASASGSVNVFNGAGGRERPMSASQVAGDKIAMEAASNAQRVMDFLRSDLGRNGLDGRGSNLDIVVHAPDPFGWLQQERPAPLHATDTYESTSTRQRSSAGAQADRPMNNAYWDLRRGRMYLGDGDGKLFTPLGGAVDIIAHEAGHAILASEVKLTLGPGQEGALHESFGDVLGVLVDPTNWMIGESAMTPGTPGDSVRDISTPQKFSHMRELRGEREPHLLADIPNLAAYRAGLELGRDKLGKVWYDAFTEKLKDHGKFSDAALATIASAKQLYGDSSGEVATITQAWESVGVLDAAGKPVAHTDTEADIRMPDEFWAVSSQR